MRAWSCIGRCVGAALIGAAVPAGAQTPARTPAPPSSRIALADAVRLAVEHNHQLRAQRLNVDLSKADEVTAALKPNPVLVSTNENFPIFSPERPVQSRQLPEQPEFRRVAQLLVRTWGQTRKTHPGGAGYH